MSSFEVNFPDDFLGDLLNTSAEEICIKALSEAAPIMEQSMKRSARAAVMHAGESDMVNSIKATMPKKTKDGDAYIVNVGPTGKSEHSYNDRKTGKKKKEKVSNALKAVWKEYGIAGKQPARPFLANATRNAEEAVVSKMQEVYGKETQHGSDG